MLLTVHFENSLVFNCWRSGYTKQQFSVRDLWFSRYLIFRTWSSGSWYRVVLW